MLRSAPRLFLALRPGPRVPPHSPPASPVPPCPPQCVYKSGKALSADQVAVWVSGEWLDVEAVHVAEEDALFSEFANDKDGPSWDVAVLALKQASTAQWVALPTSDVPVAGEQVEQTAWLEEEQYVE